MELKKSHLLASGTSKFGISTRMRSLLCLVGQSVVYEEGCELLEALMDVDISAPQIQRLCQHYGQQIDPLVAAQCEPVIPQLEGVTAQDSVYVMVDGSMVYIREEEWREMKLGRIFTQKQVVDIHPSRREIMDAVYVSHLGSVDVFLPKLESHLLSYGQKIILGDGATWIWNWAEDNYPGAIQVLDFYHAKEKLVLFARHQFRDETQRSDWVKQQTDRLLNNELEAVFGALKACRARNTEAKEAKQKARDYYLAHESRMQYKTYREQGIMIGSGPIEAAHRSVIQQRMKLSGQKWSIKGANAIANLRCYKRSRAWDRVDKIIAAAA